MANYIKAITANATASAAAEFILIPVDGVQAITFGGSPGCLLYTSPSPRDRG